MGHERCKHTEPRALVDDPVQTVVCKTRLGILLAGALTQGLHHIQTEVPLRPEVGRRRTGYPSSKVTARGPRCRPPGKTVRPPNTIRRRRTFVGAEIGTKRTLPS